MYMLAIPAEKGAERAQPVRPASGAQGLLYAVLVALPRLNLAQRARGEENAFKRFAEPARLDDLIGLLKKPAALPFEMDAGNAAVRYS